MSVNLEGMVKQRAAFLDRFVRSVGVGHGHSHLRRLVCASCWSLRRSGSLLDSGHEGRHPLRRSRAETCGSEDTTYGVLREVQPNPIVVLIALPSHPALRLN